MHDWLCIKPGIQEGGTECRERREWGDVIFLGMSPNIPGNVVMPNIPGNVIKHSSECRETFWGMFSNIPRNISKHSGECHQIFRAMSPNILENVAKHSREYRQTSQRMPSNIPGNGCVTQGNEDAGYVGDFTL